MPRIRSEKCGSVGQSGYFCAAPGTSAVSFRTPNRIPHVRKLAPRGAALGAWFLRIPVIHLYYSLEMSSRDFPGMRFNYMYPFGVAAVVAPIIIAAALVSALGPAESAVRGSLVEALEYE
jgi:hypothetical protein